MKPLFQLYTREGCHLCEDMQVALAQFETAISVELVDVDCVPELARRFGALVPVVAAGEQIICYYTLDGAALNSYLASRAAAVPPESQ